MIAIDLLEQKDLFDRYWTKHTHQLSSYSFVNIFLWQDFFQFEFKVIDDELCIFAQNEIGTFLYLPPLGQRISPQVVEKCFAYLNTANRGNGVSRIENVSYEQLQLFLDKKCSIFKKGYEYVYYKKDLVDLNGTDFKSKRWAYNHFIKHNWPRFLAYDDSMREDCLHLYSAWARNRKSKFDDEIYLQMLEENASVHALGLKHHQELGLLGRVVMVKDTIVGYTFGYELNPLTFSVLFEITDLHLTGLSVYTFRELCRDQALQKYQFINVMDDFALKNIEQTKMSFQPSILFPSFVVRRKIVDEYIS